MIQKTLKNIGRTSLLWGGIFFIAQTSANMLPMNISWNNCYDSATGNETLGIVSVRGNENQSMVFEDKKFYEGVLDFFCRGSEPRFRLNACEEGSSCLSSPPIIDIMSPTEQEADITTGHPLEIIWTQENAESISIGYKSCPDCFEWITEDISTTSDRIRNAYTWDIPVNFPKGSYQIEIFASHPESGITRERSKSFEITTPPQITELSVQTGTTIPGEILYANQDDATILNIRFNAYNEKIFISNIYLKNVLHDSIRNFGDRATFKLYNESGQILKEAQMIEGHLNFKFLNTDAIGIPQNNSTFITIKADIRDIQKAEQTGAHLQLALDTEGDINEHKGIQAYSRTGNLSTPPNGWGEVISEEFIAYKSEFFIQHDYTQPSIIDFDETEHPVYRIRTESHYISTIELGRITLDIELSGIQKKGGRTLSDEDIRLIIAPSENEENKKPPLNIARISLENVTTTRSRIHFDLMNQVLYPGNYKSFEVLLKNVEATNGEQEPSVRVQIVPDEYIAKPSTRTDKENENQNIIWSDESASFHSDASFDWLNGYLLEVQSEKKLNNLEKRIGTTNHIEVIRDTYFPENYVKEIEFGTDSINTHIDIDNNTPYEIEISALEFLIQGQDAASHYDESFWLMIRQRQDDNYYHYLELGKASPDTNGKLIFNNFTNYEYEVSLSPNESIEFDLYTVAKTHSADDNEIADILSISIVDIETTIKETASNIDAFYNGEVLSEQNPIRYDYLLLPLQAIHPPYLGIYFNDYISASGPQNFEVALNRNFSATVSSPLHDEDNEITYKLSYYNNDEVFPDVEITTTARTAHFDDFRSDTIQTWTFMAQACYQELCSEWSKPIYVHIVPPVELDLWSGTGSTGSHDLFDIIVVTDTSDEELENILNQSFGDGPFSLFATDPFLGKNNQFNIYYYQLPKLNYKNTNMCRWGESYSSEEGELFNSIFNQFDWSDLTIHLATNSYIWPAAYPTHFEEERLVYPGRIFIGTECDRIEGDYFPRAVVHEMGHAFGNLRDEYLYGKIGKYPSDPKEYKNCAYSQSPATKWNHISHYQENLYQGCTYEYLCESNNTNCDPVYRGTDNSIMRDPDNENIINSWQNGWRSINKYYLTETLNNISTIFNR